MDARSGCPSAAAARTIISHLAHLGDFELFDVLAREHAAIFKFSRRMSRMVVRMTRQAEKGPKRGWNSNDAGGLGRRGVSKNRKIGGQKNGTDRKPRD